MLQCRAVAVSLREFWTGTPEQLSAAWTLRKGRKTAECAVVWSHEFGWEIRLLIGRELVRSQVVRSNQELTDVATAWRAAMLEKGWQARLAQYERELDLDDGRNRRSVQDSGHKPPLARGRHRVPIEIPVQRPHHVYVRDRAIGLNRALQPDRPLNLRLHRVTRIAGRHFQERAGFASPSFLDVV